MAHPLPQIFCMNLCLFSLFLLQSGSPAGMQECRQPWTCSCVFTANQWLSANWPCASPSGCTCQSAGTTAPVFVAHGHLRTALQLLVPLPPPGACLHGQHGGWCGAVCVAGAWQSAQSPSHVSMTHSLLSKDAYLSPFIP